MKKIEQALKSFTDNEDIDEGNENLRNEISTLRELRYALAVSRQKYPDEYEDILEALIEL